MLIFMNMKLILEKKQYERMVLTLTEMKKSRSLLAARKAGIGAIFPKTAVESNPMRFRPYTREQMGIEETDLSDNFYTEDNSDPQL
jgi:hypothetical protein